MPADGVGISLVTVTLKDAYGNPVPGQTVTLSSSRGAQDTITTVSGTSNSSGQATFNVKSTYAGTPTLTATSGVSIGGTPATFATPIASSSLSTVSASSSSINADGVATSTITVTLVDSNSVALSGKSVTLSSSRGAQDAIAPASATTNVSGQATFAVSSIHFGSSSYSATDTTDSIAVTASASVTYKGYRLAFTTEPSSTATASTNLATQPVVGIEDAVGAVDTTISGGTMTLQTYSDSQCTTSASYGVTYSAAVISSGSENFSGAQFSANGLYYLGASLSGYTSGCSTQVKIGPALSVLHSFAGGTGDGLNPYGNVILSGTVLYGMTQWGGTNNLGTIFSYDTSTSTFTVLHSFAGGNSDGGDPTGSLLLSGTTLYGMTPIGGSSNQGTIFSIGTSGSGFAVLHSFAGGTSDGAGAFGGLIMSGSTLYGMTPSGGSSNDGTIFSYDTSTSAYSVLHMFIGGSADGQYPYGDLTLSGSMLYGMTQRGGSPNKGTIFSIGTSGSGFAVLHIFAGGTSDGNGPDGSLVLSGSTLYGLTQQGGSGTAGTIFSIGTSGSGFTVLHSFAGGSSDGSTPYGSLTLSGSTLYGFTNQGGSANAGTIFSIGITGEGYALFHSFAGGSTDGSSPYYGALAISGSTLYGMTYNGGSSSNGALFRF